MASSLKESESRDDRVDKTHRVRVTFLASEWGSSKGGLSTINRELAIQLAKCPEVEVSFFLPQCSQDDKKLALKHNVKIVEAAPLPGFEQLDWLCFPPEDLQIDIIIGHGAKLGKQAQIIKRSKRCKWVQVVHTDPEELGMFKNYSDGISKGVEKHKTEIKLCEMADHVVGVGPKLSEAFRSYLRSCQKDDNVVDFTPGVFEEFAAVKQAPSERQQRSVLVFGRGDVEDFKLKGFDIAGKAVAELEDTRLVFVGAPDGKHEEIANRLTECGVPASRLRVREFLPDRESLKRLFQEVDLVVMPSRTEGFGLTGLEALSAGLPVLVSRNSGFGEALCSLSSGSMSVINTEDPAEWTSAIKKVWAKDRKNRLEEAETLRCSYERKYNWAKQINDLIEKMISWIQDDSSNVTSPSETTGRTFSSACKTSQRTEGMDEHRADLSARKQPSSSVATKEELPDSLCLEECQKHLRSIYETNSKVKIVPWDQSSAVHIDEIYTQLSWLMDEKKPSGVTQKELEHYTDIFDGGRLHHTPKRILVHGRPGIGKTVFTQKATFDWSQQKFKGKLGRFDLVLLVKLRDVCNLNDVPAILRNANLLASDSPISTDNLYDYVRRHQENVLLILDGYDEYVHSAASQSPVLKIWEKKQLRDCCVVITSRDMKGEGLKSSSDAQFEIDGFDLKGQVEFAGRFLKDGQDIIEFFEYLKQQDLEDVAKIPILLLMLLLVWKEKDCRGLPSSRPMIYFQFLQTMFNHMSEKQKKRAEKVDDHKEELCKVGELAFDALLQDLLYFPLSKLPDYVLTEKLIEAGLFQLLNMSALNPCKAVHFIHKSLQEFLASLFLKEELLSQESKNNSLFKVDSVEKIFKLKEVFKFVAEMSEEAAREILIHLLGMAAKEDGEYSFDNQAPSVEDLSETQRNLLTLCTQLFFCCSADTRTELFPTYLSNLGGVLFILNPEQLNITAKENFVKTTASLLYIFFSDSCQYTKQSYNNLICLTQQLKAVIVSRTGKQKASEYLTVFPWRRVNEFFLMKEENNTHLYFTHIVNSTDASIPFPFKMVKTLVSLEETTKKTNMNGDESSEENSSSCCSKRHGLSRVRWIIAYVNRSEVELMMEMMLFITAPHVVWVWGKDGEVFDAEVTESLMRRISTHKLEWLTLHGISVTSSPAVEFINRVFEQDLPNLKLLYMSDNPLLGAGVDTIIKHLSSAPHLEELNLRGVKMTPQQVMNLASAVKQHGNITVLGTDYHDNKGNPKPEHEWPSEDDWKTEYSDLSSDSSPESAHEQEQDVPGGDACMWPQEPGGKEAPGRPQTSHDDDDGEGDDQSDSSEDDDGDEDAHGTALEGAYDPSDYEHLHVSQEIKDLFRYITRYTPQTIDVEHKLKPFNRDFIPAVGDIDAFLKVTRPDGKPETLGLVVLDEPIAKQSDPTVLDMTIRTISKQTNVKAMTVRSIEDPEKNPKAVDNWIDSIRELHQQKPSPAVHYQRNMPDIEFLMQEWPEEFEELLNKVGLPTADLDVDLKQYVDLVCGILGIPVHNNRIHALHVLFTLFSEFKNSQHFKQLAKDNQLSSDLRLDSGSGNPYTGGVAATTEHMTLSGEEAQTMSFDD